MLPSMQACHVLSYHSPPHEWREQLVCYIKNPGTAPTPSSNWDRGALSVSIRVENQLHRVSRIDQPYNRLIQESEETYRETQRYAQQPEKQRSIHHAAWLALQSWESKAEHLAQITSTFRRTVVLIVVGSLFYERVFRAPLPVIGSNMTPIKWGAIVGVGASWEIKPFEHTIASPRLHKCILLIAPFVHARLTNQKIFGSNGLFPFGLGSFGIFWHTSRQLQRAGCRMLNRTLTHPHRNYSHLCNRLRQQSKHLSDQLYGYLVGNLDDEGWQALCADAQALQEGTPILAETYAFPFEIFKTEVLPVCRRILALKGAVEGDARVNTPDWESILTGYWEYQQFGKDNEADWHHLLSAAKKALNDESLRVREIASDIWSVGESERFHNLPGLKEMRKLPYRILRLKAWIECLEYDLHTAGYPSNRKEDLQKLYVGKERLQELYQHTLLQEALEENIHQSLQKLTACYQGTLPVDEALLRWDQLIAHEILTVERNLQTMSTTWQVMLKKCCDPGDQSLSNLVDELILNASQHPLYNVSIPCLNWDELFVHLRPSIPSQVDESETHRQILRRIKQAHTAFEQAFEWFQTTIRDQYTIATEIKGSRQGLLTWYHQQAQKLNPKWGSIGDTESCETIDTLEIPRILNGLREAHQSLLELQPMSSPSSTLKKLNILCDEQNLIYNDLIQYESKLKQCIVTTKWVDPFHFELAVILARYYCEEWPEIALQLQEISRGTTEPRDFVDQVFQKAGLLRVPSIDDRFYHEENAELSRTYCQERFHQMLIRDGRQGSELNTLICDFYLFQKQYNSDIFSILTRPDEQSVDRSQDNFDRESDLSNW